MEFRVNWQLVSTVLMLANFAGTVGVAVWVWLRGPSEANAKHLDQLDQELERLSRATGDRLLAIEGRMQFIPTVTEMGDLQAEVREMRATQASLQREMHQMGVSLARIEDFLLSPSKR